MGVVTPRHAIGSAAQRRSVPCFDRARIMCDDALKGRFRSRRAVLRLAAGLCRDQAAVSFRARE